jgi:hypothetical protein
METKTTLDGFGGADYFEAETTMLSSIRPDILESARDD